MSSPYNKSTSTGHTSRVRFHYTYTASTTDANYNNNQTTNNYHRENRQHQLPQSTPSIANSVHPLQITQSSTNDAKEEDREQQTNSHLTQSTPSIDVI